MLEWLFGKEDPKIVARTQRSNQCSCDQGCSPGTGIPGAYNLQNFHDLGCNPSASCLPGFLPQDGFGEPMCAVNASNNLRFYQLSNLKQKTHLGALPFPTMPFRGRGGCISTDTESQLFQGMNSFKRKTDKQTWYDDTKRRFDYLDQLGYNPESHAVEPFPRIGVSTYDQYLQVMNAPRK